MIPRIDKYGFTKYDDILRFTDEVFRPIEECLQNNLYQDCVLQINPKTYEYSVCKSSEAIPGNDVYPIFDMAYPDYIGKMHCNYQKLHEILKSIVSFTIFINW